MHGTRLLSWSQLRTSYGRLLVNLRNESRWVFLNTLFSVSEAVMYAQVRCRSRPAVWVSLFPKPYTSQAGMLCTPQGLGQNPPYAVGLCLLCVLCLGPVTRTLPSRAKL